MNFLDVIILLLYIAAPFVIKGIYSRRMLIYLYFYHSIFVFVYWFGSKSGGADSYAYWFQSRFANALNADWFDLFTSSTKFVLFLNYPLVKFLGLSFLSGSLIYGFIGFLGLVNLYTLMGKLCKGDVIYKGLNLSITVLFLLNVNYWTSGIGKDALCFFLISVVLLQVYKKTMFSMSALLSFAVITFVRPHVSILLLISIGMIEIFSTRVKFYVKMLIIISGLIVLPFAVDAILNKINVESATDIEALQANSEQQAQRLAASGGSGIDMTSYPFPLKVFTFLYRPLFLDAPSIRGFIVSIENLFFLYLSWLALSIYFRNRAQINLSPFVKILLVFTFISCAVFVLRASNLGLIARMKNMIVPFTFVAILYVIRYKQHLLYRQKEILNQKRNWFRKKGDVA